MEVIFFNTKTEKFFESLEERLKARADHALRLLKEYGSDLRMPYSKPLGRGLFELRIVGLSHIRFMYSFYDSNIWLLNGFVKKSNKTPKEEINYARGQLKSLLR